VIRPAPWSSSVPPPAREHRPTAAATTSTFTDTSAAQAWTATHAGIPGQILDQAEAEQLGTQLFGHLLTG
jgi:hypothetical protein